MALDANGLHTDRPNAITTWTDKRVEPLAMRYEDFDILDIAHALARQCRYNGHVEHFYSVARHSVLVSEALAGTGFELAGLLHDAAEAYTGDLVRPLKASAELAAFKAVDLRLDEAVAHAFGLPWPQPAEVMEADRALLVDGELPRPHGLRWTWDSTPADDELAFLRRFSELTGWMPEVPFPTPPLLVGLSGYAQSGKDTAARVLMEHFGFERRAFADKMRAFLYAVNPLVFNDASDWSLGDEAVYVQDVVDKYGWDAAKVDFPEVRQLMQRLGTEAGREVLGENVWVDATMAKVDGCTVFTDVRFPNEYDAIKAAGGEVWRIARPGTSAVNMHPSETALDAHTFDLTIHNDKGVLELDRRVHAAAASLFAGRR